jgi:hypothetical protein
MTDHALEEAPPESVPVGAEARFITTLQTKHPEFTLTEIRKVLHHCALELALDKCGDLERGRRGAKV